MSTKAKFFQFSSLSRNLSRRALEFLCLHFFKMFTLFSFFYSVILLFLFKIASNFLVNFSKILFGFISIFVILKNDLNILSISTVPHRCVTNSKQHANTTVDVYELSTTSLVVILISFFVRSIAAFLSLIHFAWRCICISYRYNSSSNTNRTNRNEHMEQHNENKNALYAQ